MRKSIFLLLFVLAASISFSQTVFGLKTGVNIANMKASASGGISVTLDSKLGFHGGAFFTIPAAKNFSIQPEVVYSLEGAEVDQLDADANLHMINLPVMFQYNASGLIIEAGPQIGFLLSAREDGEDATDGYENVNLALGFGAAYRLKQGVGFGARYNLGLTSIAKDDSQNVSVKSNVFQIGLTFNIARLRK